MIPRIWEGGKKGGMELSCSKTRTPTEIKHFSPAHTHACAPGTPTQQTCEQKRELVRRMKKISKSNLLYAVKDSVFLFFKQKLLCVFALRTGVNILCANGHKNTELGLALATTTAN